MKRIEEIYLVILGLLLSGCIIINNENNSTIDNSLSTIDRDYPSPIKRTVVPLLTNDEANTLQSYLELDKCLLPCYIGITPGISHWEETKQILSEIGAIKYGDTTTENMNISTYTMRIGITKKDYVTREPNAVMGAEEIYQSITIYTIDNVVQGIDTFIATNIYQSEMTKYWNRYLLHNVFTVYGIPDNITYNLETYDIQLEPIEQFIIYEERGVVIKNTYYRRNKVFCLESPTEDFMILELSLTNLKSGLSIYHAFGMPPDDYDYYTTIEDALGISAQDYYRQVLLQPEKCFTVGGEDDSK